VAHVEEEEAEEEEETAVEGIRVRDSSWADREDLSDDPPLVNRWEASDQWDSNVEEEEEEEEELGGGGSSRS
jgi:hypothetical protein